MTSRDRRRIEELEDEDRLMARREHNLERVERSCLAKCALILRPFQVVFGIIFFAMALLVFFFPIDYILMVGIILYFFFCSMGGLQHIGIWCCWIRVSI